MIVLTLALAAAASLPQDNEGPARLHPPGSLVYAETPDVADVLIAYENAPLAQMIADPEVQSSVVELLATTPFDIEGTLAEFAAGQGIPPALLAAPLDTLSAYLAGIDSTSFSLSLREDTPGEFEKQLASMLKSAHRIGLLREHLTTHASENYGQYPASLAGLTLEESMSVDGWGRLFEYRVSSNASTYELRSLGADGAIGGQGGDQDLDTGASLRTALASEALSRVGATLIAEFSAGATASQTHEILTRLASESPLRVVTSPAPGSDPDNPMEGVLTSYELGTSPSIRVWILLHESRLVVGSGSSTPDGYFARLGGAGPSAASSPPYAAMQARFPASSGAWLTRGFLSVEALVRSAKEVVAVLGEDWGGDIENVPMSTWGMKLDGDRFITDAYTQVEELEGQATRSLGWEPMSGEIWALIPEESIIVGAMSIDAGHLYRKIMGSLGSAAGAEHVPSALTEMEEQYGFNLEADLFGSIGSDAAFYMLPVTGVMSVPGMAVIVKLDDPETFQKGLEGFLALLGDKGKDEFVIKFRPYRDRPMWYFTFNQKGGSPIPISPSLVIFDDHLIITLTNLRGKREIKRLGQEPGGLHALFNSELPEGVAAAWYLDWASFTDGVYSAGRAMLSLLGGGMELPFDITALPEPETFTRFFQPTVAWSKCEGSEYHVKITSSFGPETLASLAGAALAGTLVAQNALPLLEQPRGPESGEDMQHVEVVMLEVEGQEVGNEGAQPEAAEHPPTDETLSFLSTRLAIYRLENARYPAALGDLTKATENYPRGFLGAGELPLDEWGKAFSYTVSEDGGKFQLWSLGADGIDQQGSGDDLVPR